MPLSPGQMLNNRYRIDSVLGQGGMGAVYEGWDNTLGIRVALKENLLFTEAATRQFEREARLLASLRHPNLPRVNDHFVISGQGQYLVMDFVEGNDLRQRLDRLGTLPEADVLRWADSVLDALAYVHKRNIIHRDIKPNNIKITPEGEAVLVDFGIAKEFDAEGGMTTTGARGLTPGFAPPEQYGLSRTDARSDIYAVGATLYLLLSGALPADALMRMRQPEKYVRLGERVPTLNPVLAGVVDRALAMEPDERFQTANEMRKTLLGETASPNRDPSLPSKPTWQASPPAAKATPSSTAPTVVSRLQSGRGPSRIGVALGVLLVLSLVGVGATVVFALTNLGGVFAAPTDSPLLDPVYLTVKFDSAGCLLSPATAKVNQTVSIQLSKMGTVGDAAFEIAKWVPPQEMGTSTLWQFSFTPDQAGSYTMSCTGAGKTNVSTLTVVP